MIYPRLKTAALITNPCSKNWYTADLFLSRPKYVPVLLVLRHYIWIFLRSLPDLSEAYSSY